MGDEKQARHLLADMQIRIARGAYDALGISAGEVGPDHVRASFLELAKTYHPQKFARMPVDIQKLANEVFLGLRAAHDQLARPKTNANVRQSGGFPVLSSKTPMPDLVRAPTRPATRPSSPAIIARPNVPPTPSAALNPGTQRGVPPAPTSAITPPTQRGAPPAPVRPPISTSQIPVQQRPGTQPAAARPTQPIRRLTPVGGVPATGPRPAVTQPTPAGGLPNTKPAAGGAEPELAGVYDLLQKGQWDAARTTLNALIVLQPKPRYRALLQYSLGREAQLSRRLDEARVELQNALEIDPELQLAKTALAELFTRRK